MDFELNADQLLIVDAVQSICSRYRDLPDERRRDYQFFSHEMQRDLQESGFLDMIRSGYSPLEAALVLYETSTVPAVVEVAVSALVAPQLIDRELPGPVAILSGDLSRPQRMLPVARTVLVELPDDVLLLSVDADNVIPHETFLAYPYGCFRELPDLRSGERLGAAALVKLRQWRRVALALECAAAARAATDFTVDHVKERHVFGKPIAAFQAVQHRLAQCHVIASGLRWLGLYAAWSGAAADADLAAAYAQQHIHKLVFDLHQFNGGMGLTCEQKLHLWTYRLRALQAEAGGVNAAALDYANARWPERTADAARGSAPAHRALA